MFALIVIGHSSPGPRYPLTARPTVVGRAPDCDIVLADASISRRHAAIWQAEGGVQVQDLGSQNGTQIDGEPVRETAVVGVGQVIRLGHIDSLRVIEHEQEEDTTLPLLALEELASGHRILLSSSPLRVGSHASCQLLLADGPPYVASIIRQGPSEAWIGLGDEMEELVIDQPFPLAGREYVLRLLPPSPVQTIVDGPTNLAYRVVATLDAPGGALARVEVVGSDLAVEISTENRAVFLFLLARRWAEDAAAGVPETRRGWMDDDDVAVGVWGRDGPVRQLKVLVCRVRQELREAGLDPWFVEKRRGALRLRVIEATVEA